MSWNNNSHMFTGRFSLIVCLSKDETPLPERSITSAARVDGSERKLAAASVIRDAAEL